MFISQHFTYLYLSILSVYFANILLVYSSAFIHLKSQVFTNILSIYFFNVSLLFSYFTRLLKLRSFVVSDEIPAERYFKLPHFLVPKGQF